MATGAIVKQLTEDDVLRILNSRLRDLEQSDGSSAWIPVDVASGNPLAPGYEGSWGDVPGATPLQFKRFLNWTMLRGGFFGGDPMTVVFTLPELFWPDEPQQMLLPLNDGTGFASVLIDTDGTVTYVGTCACSSGAGVDSIVSPGLSLLVDEATGPDTTLDVSPDWLAANAVVTVDGTGGPLVGAITFSEGAGITLTQVAQNIEIGVAGGTGIIYDFDNTGDWLHVATTGLDGDDVSMLFDAVLPADDSAGTVIVLRTHTTDGTAEITHVASALGAGNATGLDAIVTSADGAATGVVAHVTSSNGGAVGGDFETAVSGGAGNAEAIQGIASSVDGQAQGASISASASGIGDAVGAIIQVQDVGGSGDRTDVLVLDKDGDPTFIVQASGLTGIIQKISQDIAAATNGTGIEIDLTGTDAGTIQGYFANVIGLGSTDVIGAAVIGHTFDGQAIGAQIQGEADGAGLAFGATVEVDGTDGDTVGIDLTAAASGAGNVTGLRVQALTDGSGTVYTVLVLDPLGNPIFRIDPDASVHIKTGTSILADL